MLTYPFTYHGAVYCHLDNVQRVIDSSAVIVEFDIPRKALNFHLDNIEKKRERQRGSGEVWGWQHCGVLIALSAAVAHNHDRWAEEAKCNTGINV